MGVTVVVFVVTIFFITKISYTNAQEDAQAYIDEMAKKQAAQIQVTMDKTIVLARALRAQFEESLNTDAQLDEEHIMEYLKTILRDNDHILSTWFKSKQRDLFFTENLESKGENGYDKTGQFNPYVAKSQGKPIIQAGAPYNEEDAWIGGPKKSGKDFITAPYMFPIDGEDVLMTTIAIPMFHNDRFIGSIGLDISLETFSQMATATKIYDNGYSFILDGNGKILGHPNKELLLKDISTL